MKRKLANFFYASCYNDWKKPRKSGEPAFGLALLSRESKKMHNIFTPSSTYFLFIFYPCKDIFFPLARG